MATPTALRAGALFSSRREMVQAIHDEAETSNKGVKLDKYHSGGTPFAYKCNSEAPCTFRVFTTRSRAKSSSTWCVQEAELAYDGGCAGVLRSRRSHIVSAELTRSAVVSNTKLMTLSLQHQIHSAQGVRLPIRSVQRVIQDVRQIESGGNKEGYQKL